jgi:hypothetical protein
MKAATWSKITSVHMDIPDFQEWGWHKDSSDKWLPYWTALEDSSKASSILLDIFEIVDSGLPRADCGPFDTGVMSKHIF